MTATTRIACSCLLLSLVVSHVMGENESRNSTQPKSPSERKTDDRQTGESMGPTLHLGTAYYAILRSEFPTGENIAFSPHALCTGLFTAAAGADHQTRTELLNCLGGDSSNGDSSKRELSTLHRAVSDSGFGREGKQVTESGLRVRQTKQGVEITAIGEFPLAKVYGLHAGDLFFKIGNRAIVTVEDVRVALKAFKSGDPIEFARGAPTEKAIESGLSILLNADLPVLPGFRDSIRGDLGGGLLLTNGSDPEDTTRAIENWFRKINRGEAPPLPEIPAWLGSTGFVILSGCSMESNWRTPFLAEQTKDRAFWSTPEASRPVPTMRTRASCKFADLGDCSCLELPFGSHEHALILFLPRDRDGLVSLESQFNATFVATALDRLSKVAAGFRAVEIPRFQMSARIDAKHVLEKLGVVSPFESTSADFGRMTKTPSTHLANLVHTARISINEGVAQAVMAQADGAPAMDAPTGNEPPTFRADHPFLWTVVHRPTSTLLLLGRFYRTPAYPKSVSNDPNSNDSGGTVPPKGLVVHRVFPRTTATRLVSGRQQVSLQPGDVVYRINHQPLRTIGDFTRFIDSSAPHQEIVVEFTRRNRPGEPLKVTGRLDQSQSYRFGATLRDRHQ